MSDDIKKIVEHAYNGETAKLQEAVEEALNRKMRVVLEGMFEDLSESSDEDEDDEYENDEDEDDEDEDDLKEETGEGYYSVKGPNGVFNTVKAKSEKDAINRGMKGLAPFARADAKRRGQVQVKFLEKNKPTK